MSKFASWQSGSAVLAAVGMLAGAAAPIVISAPATAQQANFSDVSFSYWARPFIERLASENIIAGFPDGTFKPDQPVTRAQFAAIVQKAFDQASTRSARSFPDVPTNYWASEAIRNAYIDGFLSGYPDGTFQPAQEIPRVQVLVSLVNGLGLSANGSVNETLDIYSDEGQIPDYAQDEVAAATQRRLVVSYPNTDLLNPQQVATRADVAAFVYQALVAQGQLPALAEDINAADYIVGYTPSGTNTGSNSGSNPTTPGQNNNLRIGADTLINVRYPNASTQDVDIVVAPGQTVAIALEVEEAIRNANGQVLVPVGSAIQGRIVPVSIQGSSITAAKYVADRLTVGDRTYDIRAESSPIAATENVSPGTLQGALVTAAAESIVGGILGNRDLGGLIGQVITGSDNTTSQNAVVVIQPNQIDLRVISDLYVNAVQ